MAWDNNNQFGGSFGGGIIEYGNGTIGSDGTVEIATTLGTILAATATISVASGDYPRVSGTFVCDKTITSGAVTFEHSAGADANGMTFTYILIGR